MPRVTAVFLLLLQPQFAYSVAVTAVAWKPAWQAPRKNATFASPMHILNTSEVVSRGRHMVNLFEDQAEYEFDFSQGRTHFTMAVVNKVALVLFTFCCGCCGVDRCYTGAYITGVLKALTGGLMGLWTVLDIMIICVNAWNMSASIDTLGFKAQFQAESIQTAFYVAPLCLTSVLVTLGVLVKCRFLVQDAASAYMPTRLARHLRGSGLLCITPSIQEAEGLFKTMDSDGSGTLDREELKRGLEDLGLPDAEIDAMIREVDGDGDGRISLAEFLAALQEK